MFFFNICRTIAGVAVKYFAPDVWIVLLCFPVMTVTNQFRFASLA